MRSVSILALLIVFVLLYVEPTCAASKVEEGAEIVGKVNISAGRNVTFSRSTTSMTLSESLTVTPSITETNFTPSMCSPSLSTVTEISRTITDSASLTLSMEEIPDNMYTRAESCKHVSSIQACSTRFCVCLSRRIQNIDNLTLTIEVGMDECTLFGGANCYYHLYCIRERVSCLWRASVAYSGQHVLPTSPFSVMSNGSAQGSGVASGTLDEKKKKGNVIKGGFFSSTVHEDDTCYGAASIYGNLSIVSATSNYYDSLLYRECIQYVRYLIRKTGGNMCLPTIVPIYVCGPSFPTLAPLPDPIKYTPISSGTRRLVITITARFVGDFAYVFAPDPNHTKDNIHTDVFFKVFNDRMRRCFKDAIGIDGEFMMTYMDDCLMVKYGVGVSEADPWVGDEVTANALNLMVRNVTWLHSAQVALGAITDNYQPLHTPIVVYEVIFDAGKSDVSEKECDANCVAGLAAVTVIWLLVTIASFLLCCLRRGNRHDSTDIVIFSDEEEMEAAEDLVTVKRK